MKAILVLTLALFSSLASAGGIRTYLNYPDLTKLIDAMAEAATYGGSIEYFGYNEGAFEGSNISCAKKPFTSQDVAGILLQQVDDLVFPETSDLTQEQIDKLKADALPQFLELIGEGPFTLCNASASGNYSYTSYNYFISPTYQFWLEIGMED